MRSDGLPFSRISRCARGLSEGCDDGIERYPGDGAIRIPDEALQELELDVGDAVYLIEEFVGNTR